MCIRDRILSVFFGLGLVLLSYMNKLPGSNKSGLNKFIFGQASTFIERDVNVIFIAGIVPVSYTHLHFYSNVEFLEFLLDVKRD